MSNPFIKILWFQHKNLFSRVMNITRLLSGPIAEQLSTYHTSDRAYVPRDHAFRVSIQFLKRKCTNIAKMIVYFFKTGLMIQGLPSLARLALGPSGLWPRSWATNTCAALRQHLRLLLPARAYIYCREDLHGHANARFIWRILILLITNNRWQPWGAWLTTFT
jgi:hypothetical protein